MNYVCKYLLIILIVFTASGVFARSYQVAIDPGHGGSDKGVRLSGDTFEESVTLAVGSLIKKDLDKSGSITARLVRPGDTSASTAQRFKSAAKADLYIGLHVNAGFSRNSSGYEIYFPGFKTPPGKENSSGEIVKDMVRTRHLNESVRFSRLLQKNLERVFPRKGRGLRDAPIPVQGLSIPAVVIEMGFATNPKDRKALADAKIQGEIAEAIAESAREFFKGDKQ
ncbi:MAG TPA: N-acetylmuramoyl-L-alanine amidase [Syntrophales bacterium]|nr:N-acetylmuramoyl-L-alanine amidase [Syntrophales bacterium]